MSLNRTHSLRLLAALALPLAVIAVGEVVAASTPPTSTPATSTPATSTPDGSTPDGSTPTTEPDGSDPTEEPAGYVRLVDDTGFLTVVVPETWDEIDTAPAPNPEGSPQPWILASTVDLDEFNETFASGVLYYAAPFQADAEAYVSSRGLVGGCETIEVEPYEEHAVFSGFVQVGENCGETGGTWNMIVASPEDQSFTAIVQLQISSRDEQDAFDAVRASFTYAGDPAIDAAGLVMPSSVPGGPVEPVESTESVESVESVPG